jgi:hypothetical protein
MRTGLCLLLCTVQHLLPANGQYARGSSRFTELYQEGVDVLTEEIQHHPDVRYEFDPSKQLLFADTYYFNLPDSEDYRIGLLMDPVGLCCVIDI